MKSNARLLQLVLLAGVPLGLGCGGDSTTPGAGNGAASSGGAVSGSGTASGASSGAASGGATGQSGAATTGTPSGSGASGTGATPPVDSGTVGTSANAATGASGSSATGASGSSATGASGSSATGASAATGAHPDAGVANLDGGTRAGSGSDGGSSSPIVDPSKKVTVWMAGDSTMQPCTTACPCGWGSQFQPLFNANATVVNSAAGGRSIQTWLYDPNVTTTVLNGECVVSPKTYSARWQAMLDPTNGMKAGDYLFVEFGINDTDPTCNRHVGNALFQSYLGVMAQAAIARGAHPILLTSTSFMQCTAATVMPNRGFGPETKAAAAAAGAAFIDLTVVSANLYTTLGLCPNALDFTSTTSAVGKFFCNDHTHFESAGAAQIAAVVAQALRDQNIGLAAYLK